MKLLSRYEHRRKRLQEKAPPGPVRRYLNVPWPDQRSNALTSSMLALDLETSGLDPRNCEIVSVGSVQLHEGRIALDTASYHIVKTTAPLFPSSVIIHGIVDDRAAGGRHLAPVLEETLCALRGRILLGHHVKMDAAFLAQSCKRLGWGAVAFPCIDTLVLAKESIDRRRSPPVSGTLTLSEQRKQHGLPAYPAHDALCDALAAAELWLAQAQELAGSAGQVALHRHVRVWP